MKTYAQLIEAIKPKPAAIEAERLRKDAIEAIKKVIKTPNLSKQTVKNLKHRIKMLSWNDYTSPSHQDSNFKVVIPHLKDIGKEIKRELETDVRYRKAEADEKKILDNPYTICDLLSNPKPNKFINMIKGDIPDYSAKWIDKLEKIREAFGDWFDLQGGRKIKMINIFNEMVACKNRAAWASWSGKGYRGVSRSTAVVSKYDFTGEVKKIGKNEWLVAKGTYKSRYGAQSWSDVWRTAEEFTETNMSDIQNPIGVIFEVNLKKSETLLSPDVIKQISMYGKGSEVAEREVIRVGNDPIPVTIYVSAMSMVDIINNLATGDQQDDNAKMYVYDRAVVRIGVKGADAFAKTNVFKQLVRDF
jgi:hypothetical protein